MDQVYEWIASYWENPEDEDSSRNTTADIHVVEDPSGSRSKSKITSKPRTRSESGSSSGSSSSSSSRPSTRSTVKLDPSPSYMLSSKWSKDMREAMEAGSSNSISCPSSGSLSRGCRRSSRSLGSDGRRSSGSLSVSFKLNLEDDWTWIDTVKNPHKKGSSFVIQSQRDIDDKELAEKHETEWESPDFAQEWDDNVDLLDEFLKQNVMVLRKGKRKQKLMSRFQRAGQRHERSARFGRHHTASCGKSYEKRIRKLKFGRRALRQPPSRRGKMYVKYSF